MSRTLQRLESPIPRICLRTAEAAAACGVSEDFFAAEIAPHVPAVRRGRLKLYPTRLLEEWVIANAETVFGERKAAA